MFHHRKSAIHAATASLVLATGPPALAAPDCKAHGTASYQATRTVEVDGRSMSGTVYVSGDLERDETTGPDGKPAIHLKSPQRVVIFSPQTKTGVMMKPPAQRPDAPKSDATTQVERKSDGGMHTTTIKKRIGEQWVQVYRSVCRADGVLLERDFPFPLKDKMGTARMRHTAIEVKAIDAAMFQPPADVKLSEPPPPKAK